MKRTPFFILLLFIASYLPAQTDTLDNQPARSNGILLDFYSGYSIPFGKYASNHADDELSGYASGGYFIQIGASWMGKNKLGLGLTYVFQQNMIQPGAKDDTLTGYFEALGSKPWTNHYLMAGPVFYTRTGKFSILARAGIGAVLAFSPNFTIWLPTDAIDSLTPGPPDKREGPGIGVAVQLMANAGYQIAKNIHLNLSLSYLGGNPARTKDYYYYYWAVDPTTGRLAPIYQGGEIQRKRRISTFNIGLGLTIIL